MQEFMENGNLFPGIHNYTMQEFQEQFVLGFSSSQSRKEIFKEFSDWFKQLINLIPPRYVWLDGSYLTMKENPNDIDLVIFYKPEDITDEETSIKVKEMINEISRKYRCDAYLCLDLSDVSGQELAHFPPLNKILGTYWMGQFGFDRKRDPKGMVEINSAEILKFGGVCSGFSSRAN
ncbi:DUF6932 family protein [Priestia flexa]|uniref:DUF6932 family protein n=1 Tax=Priestia flexa TaxID=86664 RepID=UPI003FCF457F